jgi:hypothetical protein
MLKIEFSGRTLTVPIKVTESFIHYDVSKNEIKDFE